MYLQQITEACLQSYGINVHKHETKPIYHFSFVNDRFEWVCYVTVFESERRIEMQCRMDTSLDRASKKQLDEFLALANASLRGGSFAKDNSGRCYFSFDSVFPGESYALDNEHFFDMLAFCVKQIDNYSSGFSLVNQGSSPQKAMAAVEDEQTENNLFI